MEGEIERVVAGEGSGDCGLEGCYQGGSNTQRVSAIYDQTS